MWWSLHLISTDLQRVFGKNRAWQWQWLWPPVSLSCASIFSCQPKLYLWFYISIYYREIHLEDRIIFDFSSLSFLKAYMPERALAASSSVRYRGEKSPGSLGRASRHASVVVLLHCHGDSFLQICRKYSPRLSENNFSAYYIVTPGWRALSKWVINSR